MNGRGPVAVAAGGTGGHLFPAAALSHALKVHGFEVHLITDERAAKYDGNFPAHTVHRLAAATPSGGSLLPKIRAIVTIIRSTRAARRLFKQIRPRAVIGFGGYPTVPPVLAASQLGVPVILHEGNAVIGRANRYLADRAEVIAKGFEVLGGLPGNMAMKTRLTGNPVRPMVIEAALTAFPDYSDGKLRVLVTGGSQGARIFSDIVPPAIELLPPEARRKLHITQQARAEDEERVRETYKLLGVDAEIRSFFADLPERIAQSHLVIARAGASTVSELAVIGRPAILVPLPGALDQDQAANAEQFAASGAAIVVTQSVFSPQWLATSLVEAQADMDGLARRAAAAKRTGITDAAERLADLVLGLATNKDKVHEVTG
ncbi:undecaprenyldiphospho-muramoylpentapeptide beta-N-acetylglucosaminyltransferase [Methylocapsa sp. D3K7]|uniref:undecaprenyldiphospho-muramoylpentapeptide beta-N-acetylglucosaminyltransferase n=1 Tax=Methylocapsa sp. D3K7 TaxID=3041435 RepID=UPI00244EB9FB|nr:undecaprenyldiphospho-muramoylpentapeptide beta-N-acetylglucosaminyltransferase [Methylocapsa sp. D3K7]WGJ15608.1 undecaprenyldiphospho-muramoylpentapeptide beta-N-acetylglucosaminyltransferase [Methylocapsa sp. D3K7]